MISFQTLFYFLACNAVMLVIAMVMEALLGWPDWLYRKIGHPVSWIAKLITWCDTRLNRNSASSFRRKSAGIVTLLCCAGSAAVIAGGLAWLAGMFTADLMYLFIMGCLSWPFIASRSLYSHVRAVLVPLQAQELQAARSALGMIVGRQTTHLDASAIGCAAAESLAENTSDGVIAPLCWGLFGGYPGLVLYKAVNTLDSMIGYRDEKYADFGWASARCDDVLNLLPARLTGLLFCICSIRPVSAFKVMIRDASAHLSPNAGWPEAALAGSMDVRLAGPRDYAYGRIDAPYIHPDGRKMQSDLLAGCLRCYLLVTGAALLILCWIGTGILY